MGKGQQGVAWLELMVWQKVGDGSKEMFGFLLLKTMYFHLCKRNKMHLEPLAWMLAISYLRRFGQDSEIRLNVGFSPGHMAFSIAWQSLAWGMCLFWSCAFFCENGFQRIRSPISVVKFQFPWLFPLSFLFLRFPLLWLYVLR